MKTKLRTRWSEPIILGGLALFFVLLAIINADNILNPYFIILSVLLIISLVRFFGTSLIINDEFIEYQHWMMRKKKVLIKDIKDVKIQKGLISHYLEISTPDMSFKIYPYFSVTLISIKSLITGRPYKFGEAQNQLNLELKKKKIMDFALVGALAVAFLALFTFRVAVMNQPEVNLVRITPSPEFPSVTELNNIYTVYVEENRIWSEEDAANAALSALKSELGFFSKLFNNTYLVYYNYSERFYVVFKIGLPNELSYVFYVFRGENEIYFKEYGEA